MRYLTASAGASMALVLNAGAQILMSGGPYAQNFNSLASGGTPSWTDNSTLPGWYASKQLGGPAITTYRADTGSGNAGALYSYGASVLGNRAFGCLVSGTPGNIAFGLRFTNDTASVQGNILVSFTGEQWRNANTLAQTLAFFYQTGTALTNSDGANTLVWNSVPALNFTTPTIGGSTTALDGTASANQTVFTNVVLSGVAVQPGQELFLRWFFTRPGSGTSHGVAIDNLTVSFSASTNSPPANSPPAVTTQPQSQTVNAGDNVIFSVVVGGTTPLSYQWQSNNVVVVGATNRTFTLASVTTNLTGSVYFVTITNVAGATNSQPATLAVNAMPLVSPPGGTNGAITLMTYNVKGNGVADWSTNRTQVQAIGRELVYLKPDIITFNEIPATNAWQMPNWVAAFMPGFYLATNSGTDGFIRSVIASRFPINRSQSWLSHANLNPFGYTNNSSQNADNFTRDLFEAEVNVPNWPLPLHVFTTHLKSTGSDYADSAAKRAAEAAAITNFFATSFFVLHPTHPFTLSGDMNDSDTAALALQRLTSAPTTLWLTNPTNPVSGSINTYSIQGSLSERIDFIFPCALLRSNFVSAQVFRTDLLSPLPPNLDSSDDSTASDHLPVLMTFANPFNAPFNLLSITRSNQDVTLKWESQNNRNYNIEASSNLAVWTLFATNVLTTTADATCTFTSNNVPDWIKFFRIYRVP